MTVRRTSLFHRFSVFALLASGLLALAVPAAVSGIDGSLTLSKYSGYHLDRIKVTFHADRDPIWGCDFKVYFEWDDVSAGLPETQLSSNCSVSGSITVPLIKGYGDYGKHKVCAAAREAPFGPGGARVCRTFTIKQKVTATPKPSPTPSPTLAPTLTPEPTLAPSPSSAATSAAVPSVEPNPTPGATPTPTAGPSASPASTDSPIGFIGGALLGVVIVVLVSARLLRPKAPPPG